MALNRPDLNFIFDLVYRRSAIVLDATKEYLVESRLEPVAREEGFGTIDALVARLRSQPVNGLHTRVVEAMTTNETTFFRDGHPFEALRTVVLPRLLQTRSSAKTLRIWSAACSTGQEPYSIAMIVKSHFPELQRWSVSIVASDLSETVLDRARQARYKQHEINRGLPPEYLATHFEQAEAAWRVKAELRSLIEFRRINLIEEWPALPHFDIVFLRNVLIYFDTPTKQTILRRARKQLASDGFLFLGGAETTMNLDDAFERVPSEKGVFYRLRR